MTHRLIVRTSATVAAAALTALATGPAFAADPIAKGSSVALVIGLAGQSVDSGTFVASHDGKVETTSGNNAPALGVVTGQNLITTGVLAQDARASVSNGAGRTEACSGLAGPGATIAEVGNGASCLTGGSTLAINAGNVDLGAISLTSGALSIPGLSNLGAIPGLGAALDTISGGLQTLLTSLGSPAIDLNLGAVTASCMADLSTATGSASIADADASLTLPGLGKVSLVNLPADPAPNTHVLTDLSAVVETIQRALTTQLDTLVSANLGPLSAAIGALVPALSGGLNTLIDTLQTQLLDVLGPQLAPLEQNVLDITLNRQQTAAGSINVTALDAQVLPAASAFVGSSLVDLKIGQVGCGPNSRVTTTPPQNDPEGPNDDDGSITPISSGGGTPTAVTSGIGSLEDGPSALALAALGGLALAGTGAGVIGFRRSLRQP